MAIRITCIKKDAGNHENPHIAISELGWINEVTKSTGRSTRIQMYDWVLSGGEALVRDANGNTAYLIAEITAKGTKFVKTKPDATIKDNLLKLEECK